MQKKFGRLLLFEKRRFGKENAEGRD